MEEIKILLAERPELANEIARELVRLAGTGKTELPAASRKHAVEVSIVFPIFNEEENIPELYRRIVETTEGIGLNDIELLFVNDGSSDRSEQIIRELKADDDRVKLINFSRNFGHQAAITAGIDFSCGDATILMDADLQDPPHVIADMISKWREGADVVYAVRRRRNEDTFAKRTLAYFFYRLLQTIANIDIPLDSGDFSLLDKKVTDLLKRLPEKNRYLRGLRSWLGFKQVAVEFDRPERFAGSAKYNFRRSASLAINGIVSFSTFPLRLAVFTGFFSCGVAALLLIYAFGSFFFEVTIARGWTSLVVVVLTIGGVQLILLGSIGEYIGRIYDEVKQRPNYVVREILK